MTLTEEEIEEYVSGKCMYLAAALYRCYGWEIQATLTGESGYRYLGHAWCIEPKSRQCVDIDGVWPSRQNGWIHPGAVPVKGLTEDTLFELTLAHSGSPFIRRTWDAHVDRALQIIQGYLCEQLPEI